MRRTALCIVVAFVAAVCMQTVRARAGESLDILVARGAHKRYLARDFMPDPAKFTDATHFLAALEAAKQAEKDFHEAFERVGPDVFKLPADEVLVADGLLLRVPEAREKQGAAGEVAVYELVLAKVPNAPGAHVARVFLPSALVEAGDLARAAERIDAVTREPLGGDEPYVRRVLGDVWAAVGSFDAARDAYASARKAADAHNAVDPATATPAEIRRATENRKSDEREFALRKLIGTRPADVAVSTWSGPVAPVFSASRGEVVVVRIGAVASESDRMQLRQLEKLRAGATNPRVWAATTFALLDESAGGGPPGEKVWTTAPPDGPLDSAGGSVEVTRGKFRAHVDAIRKGLGLGFPIAIADDAAPAKLIGAAREATLIVDRNGFVVHASTGETEQVDHLIASFTKAVLARKAATK